MQHWFRRMFLRDLRSNVMVFIVIGVVMGGFSGKKSGQNLIDLATLVDE